MKTFGTLHYGEHPAISDKASWLLVDVAPHVAIKVKRIFPRAYQGRTSMIALTDTPEIARDLEWMLDRYPLAMSDVVAARLKKQGDAHRAEEEAVQAILTRGHTLAGLMEPAVEPRAYQLQAADLALTTGGLLIGDDVGLGKTFSSLLTLRDPNFLPAVVVTLAHLPAQWLRELQKFMPWLKGHVVTKGNPYPVDADVLIMNYHKLNGWRDHLTGNIKTIIFDEVQELRHPDTMKYFAAKAIADQADLVVGLSATPIYNYGGEAHTIFSVIKPGSLGTRTEFIREWSGQERANGGVLVKDTGALGEYLRDQGLMLRRTRKDVHRELPEPIEIEQDVPANAEALEAIAGDIRALAELVLDAQTKPKERFTLAGQLDWKVRQATGIAKAPFVAEFVKLLLESEEKVTLWGWHRDVYDIWMRELSWYRPVMYTGSESATQKAKAVEAFTNGDSRVFIGSLRAGAGLDGLQTASSTVVFGELDWTPAIHHQVIGRLSRDGQESTVVAYYLTTDSGSDPVIAEVLEIKNQQAKPLIDPGTKVFKTARVDTDRIRRLAEAITNPTTQNGATA